MNASGSSPNACRAKVCGRQSFPSAWRNGREVLWSWALGTSEGGGVHGDDRGVAADGGMAFAEEGSVANESADALSDDADTVADDAEELFGNVEDGHSAEDVQLVGLMKDANVDDDSCVSGASVEDQ